MKRVDNTSLYLLNEIIYSTISKKKKKKIEIYIRNFFNVYLVYLNVLFVFQKRVTITNFSSVNITKYCNGQIAYYLVYYLTRRWSRGEIFSHISIILVNTVYCLVYCIKHPYILSIIYNLKLSSKYTYIVIFIDCK